MKKYIFLNLKIFVNLKKKLLKIIGTVIGIVIGIWVVHRHRQKCVIGASVVLSIVCMYLLTDYMYITKSVILLTLEC